MLWRLKALPECPEGPSAWRYRLIIQTLTETQLKTWTKPWLWSLRSRAKVGQTLSFAHHTNLVFGISQPFTLSLGFAVLERDPDFASSSISLRLPRVRHGEPPLSQMSTMSGVKSYSAFPRSKKQRAEESREESIDR